MVHCKLNTDSRKFLADSLSHMLENNISCHLLKYRSFENASGFFDGARKKFVCCTHSQNWFHCYIHEYCHFLQYITKYKPYLEFLASFDAFDLHDFQNTPKTATYRKAIQTMCKVEINCDKRAIKLIKQYNLSVNLAHYIAQANYENRCIYHRYIFKNNFTYMPDYSEILKRYETKTLNSFKTVWKKDSYISSFYKN